MKTVLVLLLAMLLSSCTYTMSLNRDMSTSATEMQQAALIEKMQASIRALAQDLTNAPNELEAINAVLLKHGMNRPMVE